MIYHPLEVCDAWLRVFDGPMNEENWPPVTDEPVEFDKSPPGEVQDIRKIADHFRGIYRIHLKISKKNRKLSTCNRLDLETLHQIWYLVWPTIRSYMYYNY